MRVPLDFYRILGVPHQATADQLQQAYRDRMQQLPRYHYSDEAITARKQLLEAAYTVLSDPEQRQGCDANFLAGVQPPDPWADPPSLESAEVGVSGIDIQDHQLAGALLLLQELGEYELVLQLGRPYLSGGILELKYSRLGSVLSEADIVLSLALAHLELGREQWQQNQYEKSAQSLCEKSAQSLKDGLDLLLREGLFSDVQSEIRTDLHKLRPYCILELLALSEDKQSERSQGVLLLKDMVTERGGIDGAGDDQSGLGIDDFLQFIQQLRPYLTIAEQRELFEAEARRPSAVAVYLTVYTLLVQGFTQYQPVLIRRARAMLARLSSHQDIYLEQAAFALLLGQTEEANQALELSQEYEAITFIRNYSEGSSDLIPGLCFYTERWLEDEVFPYFRDLVDQKADLKAYFADPHVQAYLEALAAETPSTSPRHDDLKDQADEKAEVVTQSASAIPAPPRVAEDNPALASPLNPDSDLERRPIMGRSWKPPQTQPGQPGTPSPNPEIYPSTGATSFSDGLSNGSSLHAPEHRLTPPPAARVSHPKEKPRKRRPRWPFIRPRLRGPQNTTSNKVPVGIPAKQSNAVKAGSQRSRSGPTGASRSGSTGASRSSSTGMSHSGSVGVSPPRSRSRLSSRRRHQVQLAGILLGLLGIGALVAVASTFIFRRSQPPAPSPRTQELPLVQLEQPPLPIPKASSQLPSQSDLRIAAAAPLTKETVKQLIQTWQSTKAEALGRKHASNQLGQMLTGPALSQWLTRAEAGKAKDQYWQYKLNRLSVDELESIGSTQAKATATINETAELFNQGRLQQAASYENTYQVRYHLVRQGGRWLIRAIEVL